MRHLWLSHLVGSKFQFFRGEVWWIIVDTAISFYFCNDNGYRTGRNTSRFTQQKYSNFKTSSVESMTITYTRVFSFSLDIPINHFFFHSPKNLHFILHLTSLRHSQARGTHCSELRHQVAWKCRDNLIPLAPQNSLVTSPPKPALNCSFVKKWPKPVGLCIPRISQNTTSLLVTHETWGIIYLTTQRK